MGATALLAGLAVSLARTRPAGWIVAASRCLALVILVAYATDQAVAVIRGDWSPERYLPFQLTDAVTIVAVIALWTRWPLAVELTYFWGLTASLQAVLTPDLGVGFPDPYYWTFFMTHSGVVVAACLLVLGLGTWPRPGAVRRAMIATAGVAAVAAVANLLTGGNYMYLREKPGSGSLLDLMGPWPWYIVAAGLLALALFAALDAACQRRLP